MRALSLLLVASLTALAGPPSRPPSTPRFWRFTHRAEPGRTHRGFDGNSLAFFEAFPASGAGTNGVCAASNPTGAKGEALTFTRGSTATCQKTATGGLATAGIANGDLVTLSSNIARVEYDANGTLGLLVESSRTNSVLRSQEFDNANWTTTATAGAVTITANQAVAPDGTATADRIQFSACPTVGQESAIRSPISGGTTTSGAASVYLKGNGSSGSITMSLNNSSGSATSNTSVTCSFNSSTWTRCVSGFTATSNAASEIILGCSRVAYGPGGTPGDTGAADVFVWQADYQAGATYITSPIPTVAASVTRSADSIPQFPVTYAALSQGSAAISVQPLAVPTTGTWFSIPAGSANPDMMGRFSGASSGCYLRTLGTDVAAGTWTSSVNRWSCSTGTTSALNGTTNTAAATTLFAGGSALAFGNAAFGAAVDGIYSRSCFDPDLSRCR